jgi:C1A family cysteine protease
MKKLSIIVLALTVAMLVFVSCNKENPSGTNEQTTFQYSLGCQFLPADQYAALPVVNAPEIELKTLPKSVTISTPPIGDQGDQGSCVAWGTTYAGRSIDWYITSSLTSYSYSTDIFSPAYVYNQIKISTCASGAYVVTGLNLLKSQGVCTWTLMPYNASDCSTMPNSTQKAQAASYKISSYGTVAINATTIKTFLSTNKPVIVAGPVNTAFENLGNGQILGKFTGSSLGGHCYCIIGYDDTKGAFKFQNSWGTGWGSSGYGWISYTYITSWWQEAYVITTTL